MSLDEAFVMLPDGRREPLDHRPTLQEAQKLVGGYVELLVLSDGRQMLVDEEGLFSSKPSNLEATVLALDAGALLDPQRGIVGNAIVLGGAHRWT